MAGVSVTVTGSNRAYQLAKQLKKFGDKELQKELKQGLSRALRPAQRDVKKAVPQYMPSGYAPVLAKALSVRTSNLASGLRITGQAKGNPRPRKVTALNAGSLRHPVFGNRERWVNQRVRPGFFDEPLEAKRPEIRAELERVLDQVAAKITS